MEFLTLPFVALFGVTLLLYYVRCSKAWQHGILLIASSVFIGYYHWQYLVVALGITFFTFYMGKAIHRYLNSRTATYLFLFSVIGLVGFWLFSRYWSGMFPIGISFYTFQALSYLIEIYWEEEPEDSLPDFTLYMLLFMKFLSGPIERGFDLLPQLKEGKIFNYTGVTRGLKLVAWGCFLKLVIADRIAAPLATVLDHLPTSSGMQILFATLLYPLQLYADFAGYTCMAIGMGRMLGFTLQRNFDRPFISQSTGELWRRWHMTLSFWVRDYIFTPLNASLRSWGQMGIYASLLVTFVAIGVWHGAGLTFALYGLFQGILVIYETLFKKQREQLQNRVGAKVWKTLMIIRTYVLFALSLLFFRVSEISDVFYAYTHIFDGFNMGIKELNMGMDDHYWIVFALAVILMLLIEHINSKRNLIEWTEQQRAIIRWPIYFAIVFVIFLYGAFGVDNFIYVQF